MNQARLDYCSVGFNCQCVNFIYAGASTICLGRMTMGMSRQRQWVLPRQLFGQIFRSRQSVLQCDKISARSDQPRQIKECIKKQQMQAERSCTDAALDQKTQNPPRQKIEYLPRHPPRQAKKAQKGMRFNQHIFLRIPGPRAYLNKAEKTSRSGS
ncbi:hypothetical protein V6N11_020020 [Hibiscus sabdariffa]|uniref:Uncharacterized protein n=1 Tax=Hibiscus sabdariffa TaxID=183260 RepID=A0ABR2P8E1_9ROSI